MSEASARSVRRDLRRVAGEEAVELLELHSKAIEEAQANIGKLANSVATAHRRLDEVGQNTATLIAEVNQLDADVASHDIEIGTIHNERMRDSLRLESAFDLQNRTFWGRLRWLVRGT